MTRTGELAAPAAPTTPTASSTRPAIAGLEILEPVARGGHGTVFRARQHDHDRIVALKVLDAHLVDDATRRRFDRERLALGRLSDHPAIVALLDSGYTDGGVPYLMLEFAAGGTLADRVAAGPMPMAETTELAIRLAGAIERAHRAGIVHRDIKPANVMRSVYGDWMLTDFGIASVLDRSPTETVHATYAHTAPETLERSAPTARMDVYSLASLVATCLTGTEPFAAGEEESPLSVMRRIADEPYPDLRARGVPDDMAAVLEGALSKNPDERPASARAFAYALNAVRIAHGLPAIPVRTGDGKQSPDTVVVAPSGAATPFEQPVAMETPPPRRRRGGVAALASVVAALGIAVLALLGFGGGTTQIAEPSAAVEAASADTVAIGSLASTDRSAIDSSFSQVVDAEPALDFDQIIGATVEQLVTGTDADPEEPAAAEPVTPPATVVTVTAAATPAPDGPGGDGGPGNGNGGGPGGGNGGAAGGAPADGGLGAGPGGGNGGPGGADGGPGGGAPAGGGNAGGPGGGGNGGPGGGGPGGRGV